jgi:hypothetical protein
MWKVKRGGMKKKFQIRALKVAAMTMGIRSKTMANMDVSINKRNATAWYPNKSVNT